jgi:hypothetical protein
MKVNIHKLAAVATVGMISVLGTSNLAFATVTAANMQQNLVDSSKNITNMISTFAYILGAFLSVLGIMKIKQHVENPGNAPLKNGVIALACGGAALALPFIQSMIQGSISNGNLNKVNIDNLKMENVGGKFGTN